MASGVGPFQVVTQVSGAGQGIVSGPQYVCTKGTCIGSYPAGSALTFFFSPLSNSTIGSVTGCTLVVNTCIVSTKLTGLVTISVRWDLATPQLLDPTRPELGYVTWNSRAAPPFSGPLTWQSALYWLHAVLPNLAPGLSQIRSDALELAIVLRNMLHQRFLYIANVASWPSQDAYERFREAIVARTTGVLCQGLAWVYQDLLLSFGIPAREVGLYSNISNVAAPTHASVEVYVNNRWIVMDPTFNIAMRDASGNYLSYQQIKTAPDSWEADSGAFASRWSLDATWKAGYNAYTRTILYPPTHQ